MGRSNVCIWKLDNNIKGIRELLGTNNFREIDALKSYNIDQDEKRLYYKWIDSNPNIKEKVIDNEKYKYLETYTHIEKTTMPYSKIIANGVPIPKINRISIHSSEVLFFERVGQAYCIVKGSKSLEGTIRSQLMGDREKWGKLEFQKVPQYFFDKSFYYWLLRQKGKELTWKNKKMTIQEVKGFKCNTDRNVHSYNGEGKNIDQEIPLKSIIGMDESLISLYVNIKYNNYIYSFYLDYDARLDINEAECGQFATQDPQSLEISILLMDIYFDIVPFLTQQHNRALKNGWSKEEIAFRKEAAKHTIQRLMNENHLTINDFTVSTKTGIV